MNPQKVFEIVQRVFQGLPTAKLAMDSILNALSVFNERTRVEYETYHQALVGHRREEWQQMYSSIDHYAADLAASLAMSRDSLSLGLIAGLDGTAEMLNLASSYPINARAMLDQPPTRKATREIEKVARNLRLFLLSWGRGTATPYRGPSMEEAIAHALHLEREANYFADYLKRLLDGDN